jgi:hypothetical protein
MTFRQTDGPAVAAAKASISLATAYRFEQDHRPPSSMDKARTRDNQTEQCGFVAVRDSHPDCRSFSSRLSRNNGIT